jgi:hypothetical protein
MGREQPEVGGCGGKWILEELPQTLPTSALSINGLAHTEYNQPLRICER